MDGNKDNVIYNDMDESVGYYKDLKALLKHDLKLYEEQDDFENAQDICELILELDNYKDFSGLLVLSENNGMGYTINPYTDDYEVAEWVANNIAPEDDDAMPKIYGDYDRQKLFMKQVKQYMKGE